MTNPIKITGQLLWSLFKQTEQVRKTKEENEDKELDKYVEKFLPFLLNQLLIEASQGELTFRLLIANNMERTEPDEYSTDQTLFLRPQAVDKLTVELAHLDIKVITDHDYLTLSWMFNENGENITLNKGAVWSFR